MRKLHFPCISIFLFILSNYDNKVSNEFFIFEPEEKVVSGDGRTRQPFIAILKFHPNEISEIHFPPHKNKDCDKKANKARVRDLTTYIFETINGRTKCLDWFLNCSDSDCGMMTSFFLFFFFLINHSWHGNIIAKLHQLFVKLWLCTMKPRELN